MQVTARLNNLQVAPRKVRLVAKSIVGMSASAAMTELSKQVKRSSEPMSKLLGSAVANAEHNFGLDPTNLFVLSVVVGDGARLKRWKPRAFGRAAEILRRQSNIILVLEEEVEGLNRREVKKIAPEAKKTEGEEASEEVPAVAVEEKKAQKKAVAVKPEAKKRQNTVKRTTYQRKSI
ncbi:MAG: 50S ribosomal protein L22 [Candidatus Moranbacteria bacterium]|nr:50S ribosomal protein L22 [Candidatus Moranbacteria bacterium]